MFAPTEFRSGAAGCVARRIPDSGTGQERAPVAHQTQSRGGAADSVGGLRVDGGDGRRARASLPGWRRAPTAYARGRYPARCSGSGRGAVVFVSLFVCGTDLRREALRRSGLGRPAAAEAGGSAPRGRPARPERGMHSGPLAEARSATGGGGGEVR